MAQGQALRHDYSHIQVSNVVRACREADFFCSAAFCRDEFLEFIADAQEAPGLDTGFDELAATARVTVLGEVLTEIGTRDRYKPCCSRTPRPTPVYAPMRLLQISEGHT
jgi:hypothetical protein